MAVWFGSKEANEIVARDRRYQRYQEAVDQLKDLRAELVEELLTAEVYQHGSDVTGEIRKRIGRIDRKIYQLIG
jgi:hypothetical protein